MLKEITAVLLLVLYFAVGAFGQECSKFKYLQFNYFEGEVLEVSEVRGRAVLGKERQGEVPLMVCVGLFEEKTKKRVASIALDEDGKFSFNGLRDGTYRLVLAEERGRKRYNVASVANLRIKVSSASEEKRGILVHIVYGGMHSASFGELQ